MIAPPEIELPLGTVVHDAGGQPYVFVGYLTTTVSHNLHFVCGETCSLYRPRYEYRAVRRDTLIRKFPDILEREKDGSERGSRYQNVSVSPGYIGDIDLQSADPALSPQGVTRK